jgi:hypothetical protein
VLVFLIDSLRITTDNTDPRYMEMLEKEPWKKPGQMK